MAGYLIAEEGPLAGLIVKLEEGSEWVLGRDPDESAVILEDPKVSRKHLICTLTAEGFLLENLSSVNPSTQNGKVITEPVLLHEGDVIQIGSTYFLFTEKKPIQEPEEEEQTPPPQEETPPLEKPSEEDSLEEMSFDIPRSSRWLLKVISGPNAGAEFSLQKGTTYIVGRDTEVSDIIFQDLSVSRQHASIEISDEEEVTIEDLDTRNGVIVNGTLITEKQTLSSQDLIAIGTTSFLVIDQEVVHDTIISPPTMTSLPKDPEEEEEHEEKEAVATPDLSEKEEEEKSWKDLVISTKHIIFAGTFALLLLVMVTATFSLFESEPITHTVKSSKECISEAMEAFPSVQYSYNEGTGKLFLVGHVATTIDKQELSYTLNNFHFIRSIEDSVIIDELAWQNMNALFVANSNWQAVVMSAPKPGKFLLKGYVQTQEEAQELSEYITANFAYPDLLENHVVIGNNLSLRIQSMLIEHGFSGVLFNASSGEVVLSGRVDDDKESDFSSLIHNVSNIPGVRSVQNFVVYSTEDTSGIDLSSEYSVTGFSKGDNDDQFVVINKKIYAKGDRLNGMVIMAIEPNVIFLEKDGIKFRINYNLQ